MFRELMAVEKLSHHILPTSPWHIIIQTVQYVFWGLIFLICVIEMKIPYLLYSKGTCISPAPNLNHTIRMNVITDLYIPVCFFFLFLESYWLTDGISELRKVQFFALHLS